jgi:carboxyl-terminal processing protease
LVQQPFDFEDGSGVRLTIARYYTPSGRCIQRSYANGKDDNYEMDIYTRYEHGEFFFKDSIKLDESLRYFTGFGRPVYGGGGIMPDVFVPQDTTGMTSYFRMVLNRGLILQYAFQYTDRNREVLNRYKDETSLLNYLDRQGVIDQFVKYAQSKDVKPRNILIQKSYRLLERNIYGNIIYNVLGREAYITYINKSDENVKKALEILNANEAFPKDSIAIEKIANNRE